MKEKTARRFIKRNAYKMARHILGIADASPSFLKRMWKAKRDSGDTLYRQYKMEEDE